MTLIYLATAALMAVALSRQASLARLAVLLVGGQFGIHVLFSASAGHGSDPAAAGGALAASPTGLMREANGGHGALIDHYRSGIDAALAAGPPDPAVPAWFVHLVAEVSGPNALMTIAHIAAALVCAVWLASAERALHFLRDLFGRGLWAASIGVTVLPAGRLLAAPTGQTIALRTSYWGSGTGRRGPPLALLP